MGIYLTEVATICRGEHCSPVVMNCGFDELRGRTLCAPTSNILCMG